MMPLSGGVVPESEGVMRARLNEACRVNDQAEVMRLTDIIDAQQYGDDESLSRPGRILAAAQWYAGTMGLPVFPINPVSKKPYIRWGVGASMDRDVIAEWWRRWPNANVAAPTGILFDVFDIDGPEGWKSLLALGDPAELFPVLLGKVSTPRPGRHFYVPPKATRRNSAGKYGPKIDVRGIGGMVVMPPSKRDGVVGYRWLSEPTFNQ